MKNMNTKMIIKIAILAAIAAVVMIFEFPVPFAPPFYKIDLSEVIVLLAGFSLGVVPAIMVEALKILLNILLNGSSTLGIGELANFIVGCSFIIPATFLYHKNKTRKQAIIGLSFSTLSLCVVAIIMNYFVLLPVYAYFFELPIGDLIAMGSVLNPNINNLLTFVILAVLPFNLLKGVISSTVVLVIYKRVTPLLK